MKYIHSFLLPEGVFCFSGQVLAENPGISVTEVTKILGARWKELSADDRVPFEELWKADKERYAIYKRAH